MEENEYQLIQHELEVHEVMKVHREEGVFPSIYPCSEFMSAAGILQDLQTLISNAGLEHFVDGEPHQYGKLTMSVVQDFRFNWSLPNPMVHYKIYNKTVNLPFDVFCAAIKVPQWGSRRKIKERPKPLMDLYEEICQGRSFSYESGMDGHSRRMSLTCTWRSTLSTCTIIERGPKIILSSLPTLGSSYTSSLTMIMVLLLHLHESLITIMPTMTH
jgi:hypothetical protein